MLCLWVFERPSRRHREGRFVVMPEGLPTVFAKISDLYDNSIIECGEVLGTTGVARRARWRSASHAVALDGADTRIGKEK